MTRVGVHGKIEGTSKYDANTVAILAWLFNMLENALNGQIDATNLADYVSGSVSVVTTAKINDSAVTAAKLAASSVTSAAVDSTVSKIASGTYVGDSATTNRVISLAFTPRWVLVVRTDATFVEYLSIQDSGVATFYYRDSTGAQAASTVNWQGIVSGGFKLGTSATGTSNITGVTYRYICIG